MLFRIAQPCRRTAAAIIVLAVSTVTSAGCGTAASGAGGATIVVHNDANGKTVPARAGDRVELILSSSYWHVTGSSAPRVLRQDGAAVVEPRPSGCPAIPGLGCAPVRADFTALSGGTAVITASRTTCGEALRCGPNQTRFTVTVVVRNHG